MPPTVGNVAPGGRQASASFFNLYEIMREDYTNGVTGKHDKTNSAIYNNKSFSSSSVIQKNFRI